MDRICLILERSEMGKQCLGDNIMDVWWTGGHLGQGHLLLQVVVSLLQSGKLFEQVLVSLPLLIQLLLKRRLGLRHAAIIL